MDIDIDLYYGDTTHMEPTTTEQQITEDIDLKMIMSEGLSELSEMERYTLVRTSEGYTAREIASEIGYSHSWVSVLINRAKDKMKVYLDEVNYV